MPSYPTNSGAVRCIATEPLLKVVRGEGLGREIARSRLPSLAAQPFRPGELPTRLHIAFSPGSANRIRECAGRHRLPLGLWARLAIEGTRQLRRAAQISRSDPGALATQLDDAASRATPDVVGTEARGHLGYARMLRASRQARWDGPLRQELTLLLPDQLMAGWAQAANIAGMSLSEWADAMVQAAPTRVVEWEISAAEAGDTLGEWILATALTAANG